jgi:carboxypeptidase family protein
MPRVRSRATPISCTLLILLLVSWAATRLSAQATTVTIQGRVRGDKGSPLPGAQVEVISQQTSGSRATAADDDGSYRIMGLAPGMYDIVVRAIGYRPQRREGVRLIIGQRAALDFVLEPGAVDLEPILVTAERPFEVDRADVSTAVLQEEIEKLPLNTRNLLDLAVITPGIRTSAPGAARSIPAAGPLPGVRFINLYVDGVEWKGMYIGNLVGQPGLGSLVPQEAVREFRVYLNPYDAEYSRGAAWVISAVTHRGGNNLEGSVFGYHQNERLIVKGAFQAEKPDFRRYQVGFNLRGPILKDRAFFSMSYEGQISDNYIDVVPGEPAVDPDIWDQYAGTFKAPLRLHTALLRLTVPRGSHTLEAIWAPRHVTNESAFGTPRENVPQSHEAGTRLSSSVNSVQLMDSYASSSLLNELSLNFFENTNDEFPLAPGPTLRYPGIQVGINGFPLVITSRQLRAMNKTSFTLRGPAGQHVLKSGLELSRIRTITYRPANKDGLFRFKTDTSTQPVSGTIGMSLSDTGSTSGARVVTNGWLVGAYLQDQWQPVRSLTVTAGLRYDAELNTLGQDVVTPWAGDPELKQALGEEFLNTGDRRNDLDNVAPRLAVAWDVFRTGRTVARGGYGVMYDRVPIFGAQDEEIAVGWRSYEFANPGTTDPGELRRRVAANGVASTPNLVLLKDRLKTPANRQWSIGVGHQLTDHLALTLDYVNQRVEHAYVTVNANWRDSATGQRAITNRYGDILVWDDFGDAKFDALLASVTYDRPPTRLNLAYTLGWAQSEFGALTTSDFPDPASYSMQRSPADERHRIALSGFTALPFGLEVSAIMIAASPQPFLVITGKDDNHNTALNDDWPHSVRTLRREGWDHWYRTVDLRLGKSFQLPDGRLHLTVDVFNVFNWANHSDYQGNQSRTGYGEPRGDYPRRQAQLGIRYQF